MLRKYIVWKHALHWNLGLELERYLYLLFIDLKHNSSLYGHICKFHLKNFHTFNTQYCVCKKKKQTLYCLILFLYIVPTCFFIKELRIKLFQWLKNKCGYILSCKWWAIHINYSGELIYISLKQKLIYIANYRK